MSSKKILVSVCAAVCAATFARGEESLSDDATKERIVSFVTWPSALCGKATYDFRSELQNRKLTNRAWFDGDTNRLARLIAELAQTNNVDISTMMIATLGEYGTAEQLPFLYSCATNPAVGDTAVRAVLRIEGVTSNSMSMVHSYLFQTNRFQVANIGSRSSVCSDLLTEVFSNPSLNGYRPLVVGMIQDFQRDVEITPNAVDAKLMSVAPDYRYSKRRLATLRAAMQRQDAEYQDIVSSNYEVWRRTYVHDFQTNYLANAINELVAYPEANLPD